MGRSHFEHGAMSGNDVVGNPENLFTVQDLQIRIIWSGRTPDLRIDQIFFTLKQISSNVNPSLVWDLDPECDTVQGVAGCRDNFQNISVDGIRSVGIKGVKVPLVLEGDAVPDDVSGFEEEVVVAKVIGVTVCRDDKVDVVLKKNWWS